MHTRGTKENDDAVREGGGRRGRPLKEEEGRQGEPHQHERAVRTRVTSQYRCHHGRKQLQLPQGPTGRVRADRALGSSCRGHKEGRELRTAREEGMHRSGGSHTLPCAGTRDEARHRGRGARSPAGGGTEGGQRRPPTTATPPQTAPDKGRRRANGQQLLVVSVALTSARGEDRCRCHRRGLFARRSVAALSGAERPISAAARKGL